MEWWGLYEDGELIAVRHFFNPPNIFDFNMAISSGYDYEIVCVYVTRKGL